MWVPNDLFVRKTNSHWLNRQFQVKNWWKEPKTMAMNQQSIQAKNSVEKERSKYIQSMNNRIIRKSIEFYLSKKWKSIRVF